MRIGVTCGGTGGHMFPGIATAEALRQRGHEVALWLSGREVEASSVQGWSGPVFQNALDHHHPLKIACQMAAAVFRCRRQMRGFKPDALLAMGSYTSVAPVLAARWCGVPVVLHEANAVPGAAITFLSRFARVTAITFPSARDFLPKCRTDLTGFPLRNDLLAGGEPFFPPGVFTVLVMGGSQGAQRLNELAADAIIALHKAGVAVRALHLSGRRDEEKVRGKYVAAGVPHLVFGFLDDMARAYRSADMAISRSGAASCTELALCRVPALLVPYPHARRDHQAANARAMAATGGMAMALEEDLTADTLAAHIRQRKEAPAELAAMRAALQKTAVTGATARLAALVESTAQPGSK